MIMFSINGTIVTTTIQRECLAEGKFDEFGESVIHQALTNQILAYKWYSYGQNLSIRQILFCQLLLIQRFAKH